MAPLAPFGLLPPQLQRALEADGVPCSLREARQLQAWWISHGQRDLDAMSKPVRRTLRAAVAERVSLDGPQLIERVADSTDGSVRFVFRFPDGVVAEAVRIPLHKRGRFSVCLSSQAGCAMACDFCATGRLGLTRHLTPAEIVGCFLAVRADARAHGGDLTGAVFMGQGEPFHNYDGVLQAARVLSHSCGARISAKAISISTVGLVPQLRRFAREGVKYRLVVSLTSAIEDRRAQLLPVAGRFPLADLRDAVREVAENTGRTVTLAWVVMGGVNTGDDEVEALRRFVHGLPVRVNLIDVNDAREGGYRRATPQELSRFRDGLSTLGVPIVRRYSVGRDQASACGMLAARHQPTPEATW